MTHRMEKVSKTFDRYHDTYYETVNNAIAFSGLHVDFFTRVKAWYLLEEAKRHFTHLDLLSVADIGCGVGNIHPLLSSLFGNITGIDISQASLEIASEANPDIAYKHYNGNTLPLADNSLDLAFSICVMHHVPPPGWLHFLEEIQRSLKPGGLMVIFEHNPLNPLTRRVVNNCPFDADAVLLPARSLSSLVEKAGFSNPETRFILSIPAQNSLLRKIDRVFSKIPLGAQYFVSAQRPY